MKKRLFCSISCFLVMAIFLSCAGKTARAARDGDIEELILFLEEGGDVNEPQIGGRSLLSFAAEGGRIDAAKLLLEEGAEMESGDNRGKTALICAAEAGQMGMVLFLLDQGAEISHADHHGKVPLHYAAEFDHLSTLKILLEAGSQLERRADNGYNAYLFALKNSSRRYSGFSACARYLQDRGEGINPKSAAAESFLVNATGMGNRQLIRYFLELGVSTNIRNLKGEPLLCLAADDPETARLLIAHGADPDQSDRQGRTPLMKAAAAGNEESVRLFLSESFYLRSSDLDGNSALMYAAAAGETKVLRLLLFRFADVHQRNLRGKTALLIAVERGDPAATQLLLTAGSDPRAKDYSGMGVKELLPETKNRAEMERIFIRLGFDFTEDDGDGAS